LIKPTKDIGQKIFSYLVERRDKLEQQVENLCHISSRTSDPTGMREVVNRLHKFAKETDLTLTEEYTDDRSVWTWESKTGLDKGILLISHLDIPLGINSPSIAFRRDPEWIYGEGVGSSRAPLVCLQNAIRALRSIRKLRIIPIGLLFYTDEGRECRYSSKLIEKAMAQASEVLILRPGNLENNLVTQRRGWRKYRFVAESKPRRLGKIYKKRGVLRWASDCLDEFSKLTSKEKRIAVATSEFKAEAHPQMLPHRIIAEVFVSYLNIKDAETVENEMKQKIKSKDFKCTLEMISDRPPMKKTKKSDILYRQLKAVADKWEIPLDREFSLSPSVGGLVPSKIPTICGVGPIARDVDTPQEAVLRISLVQRTLLLGQYLATKARKNKK
jgi:D-alanine-D-alanine ligase